MKNIFTLSFLTLVGYYWISFFRFCHPYPKKEFYLIIGIQFTISFIAYLIGRKWGRIFTIIAALLLVRLGPVTGIQYHLVTLMGVFWGGVTGNLVLEVFYFFKNKKITNPKSQSIQGLLPLSPYLLLILFLLFLTLDRFLILFNAPFLNGFGILETMYIKNVSSKEAFALSMEGITSLLFPILYFYSEEIGNTDKKEIIQDWKRGTFWGIGIQFGIIFIQLLWDRNFLAQNTNMSLDAGRVMGLFRDSGSSTWIISILCFLFYRDYVREEKIQYLPLGLLILAQIAIGDNQGRGIWVILTLGILFLLARIWKVKQLKISPKVITLGLVVIFFIGMILYFLPSSPYSSITLLLRIPKKIINFFYTGEISFLNFDPNRFYYNLVGWNLFLENPFFGTGISSFTVILRDTSLHTYNSKFHIDNPSFYMGILSEIGILGLIYIILSWLILISWKSNIPLLLLLLIVFSFGYHIAHPDGGFLLLFILIIGFDFTKNSEKKTKLFQITAIVVFALFVTHTSKQILSNPSLPEFRVDKLESYQLLAYEANKTNGKNKYHVFKGKTIWILIKKNAVTLEVFLDNSTSKTSLRQKWSVLDKSKNTILELDLTLSQLQFEPNLVIIPDNAYYLQVEELDKNNKPMIYGDTPFCIPTSHFTNKNEFY